MRKNAKKQKIAERDAFLRTQKVYTTSYMQRVPCVCVQLLYCCAQQDTCAMLTRLRDRKYARFSFLLARAYNLREIVTLTRVADVSMADVSRRPRKRHHNQGGDHQTRAYNFREIVEKLHSVKMGGSRFSLPTNEAP